MHVLDLGNNEMSAEGATALAAYLERHRELKDLNLYMNDIGSSGLDKVPPPTRVCIWIPSLVMFRESPQAAPGCKTPTPDMVAMPPDTVMSAYDAAVCRHSMLTSGSADLVHSADLTNTKTDNC